MVLLPDTAPAHIDFSAGKTPEQLFDSDCLGCHRSPLALAHGRNAHTLTDFLRAHYTTKARSAALLATYITRTFASSSPPTYIQSLFSGTPLSWERPLPLRGGKTPSCLSSRATG